MKGRKPSKLIIDQEFKNRLMNILSNQYGGPVIENTDDRNTPDVDIPIPPPPPVVGRTETNNFVDLNNSNIYHSAHHNLTLNNNNISSSNGTGQNHNIQSMMQAFQMEPNHPMYKLLNFLVDSHIESIKRENEELREYKKFVEERLKNRGMEFLCLYSDDIKSKQLTESTTVNTSSITNNLSDDTDVINSSSSENSNLIITSGGFNSNLITTSGGLNSNENTIQTDKILINSIIHPLIRKNHFRHF